MHQQSDAQRAQSVQMWESARAASTRTKVEMLHPEWDDQRLDDEVAAILDETGLPVSIVGPSESDFAPEPADDEPDTDDQD